jgi:hypothetical protein
MELEKARGEREKVREERVRVRKKAPSMCPSGNTARPDGLMDGSTPLNCPFFPLKKLSSSQS